MLYGFEFKEVVPLTVSGQSFESVEKFCLDWRQLQGLRNRRNCIAISVSNNKCLTAMRRSFELVPFSKETIFMASMCRLYLISFRTIEPILVILNTASAGATGRMQPRKLVLHMKRLNQIEESLIFVILFVLCFQRQFILTFFLTKNIRDGKSLLKKVSSLHEKKRICF